MRHGQGSDSYDTSHDTGNKDLIEAGAKGVPVEMLISKDYAQERGRLIDPRAALSWDKVPSYGSLVW